MYNKLGIEIEMSRIGLRKSISEGENPVKRHKFAR
jgi:hypothetical protein